MKHVSQKDTLLPRNKAETGVRDYIAFNLDLAKNGTHLDTETPPKELAHFKKQANLMTRRIVELLEKL